MSIIVTSVPVWKGSGTYIGRTRRPKDGIFGNPFSHKDDTLAEYKVATVEEAIEKYRSWVRAMWVSDEYFHLALTSLVKDYLRGKEIVLVCWCKTANHPNAPCHGDVLKELIEQMAEFRIVTLEDE
jgi:hypothetical protein